MPEPARFRKTVVVEAIRYQPHDNCDAVAVFLGEDADVGCDDHDNGVPWVVGHFPEWIEAEPGDWIVKDAAGRFSVCKPEDFEAEYQPVEDDNAGRHGVRFELFHPDCDDCLTIKNIAFRALASKPSPEHFGGAITDAIAAGDSE